jgi:hypothetical protein
MGGFIFHYSSGSFGVVIFKHGDFLVHFTEINYIPGIIKKEHKLPSLSGQRSQCTS